MSATRNPMDSCNDIRSQPQNFTDWKETKRGWELSEDISTLLPSPKR